MSAASRPLAKRLIIVGSLALTLTELVVIEQSWVLALLLPLQTLCIFHPLTRREWIMSATAAVFFLAQNHAALQAGAFAFRQPDILLMPWYEPLLWGYWYLNIARFIDERPRAVALRPSAFLVLAMTAMAFSAFGKEPQLMNWAALASTATVFAVFHERMDWIYGLYGLLIGLAIECVGVHGKLWTYPAPDLAGLPFWFAAMWLTVGVLGRRFLLPLSEWIEQRLPGE